MISAREAFETLIANDPTMKAAVGLDPAGFTKIRWGWIRDRADQGAFPQITFHMTTDDQLGTDPRTNEEHQDATLMVQIWSWPGNGPDNGIVKAEEIDQALVALCNDRYHTFDGTRIHYDVGAARDYPDEPDAPVRIGRPITMGIG